MKGQILGDDGVQWLLENQGRSTHLVNRLLDYPVRHPSIEAWAAVTYGNGNLSDRATDLLALLIHDSIPEVSGTADPATVIWAIFKSRAPLDVKKKLVKQQALKAPAAALEVSMRAGWGEVVRHMVDEARRSHRGDSKPVD